MEKWLIANFCELFGFDNEGFPVARLPIRMGGTVLEKGTVIAPDAKIDNIVISRHVGEHAVVRRGEDGILVLNTFFPAQRGGKQFCNWEPEERLYRYSKKVYLTKSLEEGMFKVFSAIKYAKIENDHERQDNEFVSETDFDGSKSTLLFSNKEDGSIKKVKPIGAVKDSYIMTADFYVLCLSYAWDLNLFRSLKEADACLIIRNPREFSERLHSAFSDQHPDYVGIDGRVCYGNCLSPRGALFTKEMRFLTQREYRYTWIPKQAKERLDAAKVQKYDKYYFSSLAVKSLDVCMGSLIDIAELVDKTF